MIGIAVAVMASLTPISWKTTSISLGQVEKNELKKVRFEFTNNSAEAIQILDAKGSCGCTNVSFPKEPIDAGKTASITADFRSSKVGAFRKNIRIKTSTAQEYTYLYFSGEVVE